MVARSRGETVGREFLSETADAEKTLAELQDRIGKTVAYLATFKPY